MIAVNVIDREGGQHLFQAKPLYSLMEVLRDNDMEIEAICGGSCACATCHVLIDPASMAKLPPRSDGELDLLQDSSSYDATRSRLSCQVTLEEDLDGMYVTLAPEE